MKIRVLCISLLAGSILHAADLPTVTIEHLYYLQARAERVRRFKPEEMIDYCVSQKIGGESLESLYAQIFTMRVELAKLLDVEGIPQTDPRILTLNKTVEVFSKLLREEAKKVQNGILREGLVASDALQTIGQAQAQQ